MLSASGHPASASVPIQAPAQYPSMPFVSAHARMAEFERLREELRVTEMVRDKQVEMLQALAGDASCELETHQVRPFLFLLVRVPGI